jgi:hypothetical protein
MVCALANLVLFAFRGRLIVCLNACSDDSKLGDAGRNLESVRDLVRQLRFRDSGSLRGRLLACHPCFPP